MSDRKVGPREERHVLRGPGRTVSRVHHIESLRLDVIPMVSTNQNRRRPFIDLKIFLIGFQPLFSQTIFRELVREPVQGSLDVSALMIEWAINKWFTVSDINFEQESFCEVSHITPRSNSLPPPESILWRDWIGGPGIPQAIPATRDLVLLGILTWCSTP